MLGILDKLFWAIVIENPLHVPIEKRVIGPYRTRKEARLKACALRKLVYARVVRAVIKDAHYV